MAQVQVYNQEGRKTSKLELADSVFGIEPNKNAMHLAVVSYLAQLSLVQKYLVAVLSLGDRRVQVVLVRVQQEAHSGHTAVLLLVLSQESIK